MSNCPRGTIRRKAQRRKTQRRKDGTRVEGAKVPAACIKDRGNPGKGPSLFLLKGDKNELSKHGQSLKEAIPSRRVAVDKAVAEYGATPILRKLNALGILFKNTEPLFSRRARSDMKYIQGKYQK